MTRHPQHANPESTAGLINLCAVLPMMLGLRTSLILGCVFQFISSWILPIHRNSQMLANMAMKKRAHDVDLHSQIFCNVELNADYIEAVGFDMDFTLIQVNTLLCNILLTLFYFLLSSVQ